MNRFRVGVFMGGMSVEREASFNSGRTVCDHLDTTQFDIIPIFQSTSRILYILPWHFIHRGKISDFEHRLHAEAEAISWDDVKNRIDFAYIAMHGRYAEDGILQGMFNVLQIPYLGSDVLASAICMDKNMQKVFLKQAKIETARGILITEHQLEQITLKDVEKSLAQAQISFPLIVKPHAEGSSLGVTVVHTSDKLMRAIADASSVQEDRMQSVIIEEFLTGMEFSCIVLRDYVHNTMIPLVPTEIVPDKGSYFYDYDQKYMPGRSTKFTPARCSDAILANIQDVCMNVARLLHIETIARIDGFVTDDNRIVIIDPNTLSGMAPSSFLFRQAAERDMNHTQVINYLIEQDLYKRGMTTMVKRSMSSSKKDALLRIGVLMGGESNERETSLDSGRNVTYKLSPHTYEAVPIFVTPSLDLYKINQSHLVRNSTKEILANLDDACKISWSELAQHIDFAFIALHGGYGENGSVQGALEMLGIPYNGSGVLASALCMDKYKTNLFLGEQGFSVPKHLLISKNEWIADSETVVSKIADIGFPLVIKPHDDGCSLFVSKVDTKQDILGALALIFETKEYAFIEEYIVGMELSVGVTGNRVACALPPSQAIAAKGILSIEEKFLPGAGENQTPAPLSEPALKLVQRTIEEVYSTIGCKGYARIDCFYQHEKQSPTGQERVVILEINTLPGLTPATCIFHQAAELGIKPMEFIDRIITLGIEEHNYKRVNMMTSGQLDSAL